MGKQCSKNRWRGIEFFIGYIIGGTRVYSQSDKGFAKKFGSQVIAMGDCRSKFMLGEAKAYDPASKTKWRKDNPYKPAKTFSIDTKWLDQIREEAESQGLIPFLAYNRKFSTKDDTHIILDLDIFIMLAHKAGYLPEYETLEQAKEAFKNRNIKNEE
jgi:hypothetical protein